jgi:hypothetical protein
LGGLGVTLTGWQPEDGAVAYGGGVQSNALLVLAGQGKLAFTGTDGLRRHLKTRHGVPLAKAVASGQGFFGEGDPDEGDGACDSGHCFT